MPLLRDGQSCAAEPRSRLEAEAALPDDTARISVPWQRFTTLSDQEALRVDAVSMAVDDDVQALSDATLAQLALIEIEFPVYTDGRGYSHARTLRRRGFMGELRATGDVRLDQLMFMLRVGIDGAMLPQPVAPELLTRTLNRFTHAYQPGYPLPTD